MYYNSLICKWLVLTIMRSNFEITLIHTITATSQTPLNDDHRLRNYCNSIFNKQNTWKSKLFKTKQRWHTQKLQTVQALKIRTYWTITGQTNTAFSYTVSMPCIFLFHTLYSHLKVYWSPTLPFHIYARYKADAHWVKHCLIMKANKIR